MANNSRRQNTGNRRGRKRRRLGPLRMLLSMLLIVVAITFGMSVFFRVTEIRVAGNSRYGEKEIAGASGFEEGENLIMIKKAKAAESIIAKLPYIEQVQIQRVLPGKVLITVGESSPIANIQSRNGEYWLIDKNGKALERLEGNEPGNYIDIIGVKALSPLAGQVVIFPESQKQDEGVIVKLLTLIDMKSLEKSIKSIDITYSYDIQMQYENKYLVLLGDFTDLDYKLEYLTAIIISLGESELGEQGVIDLSFTDEKVARFWHTQT